MKSQKFFSIFIYLLLVFNFICFVQNQSFYISPVRLTNNCRENEVFTNCGSACDLTCENFTTTRGEKPTNLEPYVVLDEPCRYDCIPGCYCKKPYYRNRFGDCVKEEQCRKNFNRNEFVKELNKFLNVNFNNDFLTNQPNNYQNDKNQPRTNQKYISVNDNSESIINARTGHYPKEISYQSSSGGQNYQNFLNLDKDFFNNLFNDIFSLPKQQDPYRTSNYNTNYETNSNGNINANDDSIEKQIEKEADIIIEKIANGLKIKRFIIETLRNLVNRSQYSEFNALTTSSTNDQKDSKNGLINT